MHNCQLFFDEEEVFMKKLIGIAVLLAAVGAICFPSSVKADETDILFPQSAIIPYTDPAILFAQAQAEQAALAQPVAADPNAELLPPTIPATESVATALPFPTYVDVSIDTQTMVYYENGIPVLTSPVVTGSPGRGTPRGVFQINSKIPGKYLTGPTWHVWVDRWMRFAGNCGLHDAKWRKSFGGNIYKSNGSHGCVNLPHDVAVALYERVGVGTVVIVH